MTEPQPPPPPGERNTGPGLLDWNEAWQAARARTQRRRGRESWDRRAPSFARTAAQSRYASLLLERLPLDPSWDLLDVGCGPGTLAVPLARRVRAVTALDSSRRMLDLLEEGCAAAGVTNVRPVQGAWEDDWEALGLGRHDVALASRSLTAEDLRAALTRLDRAARRAVHLVAPVGPGPLDARVFAAAGRTLVPGPDYVYPLNLLHQLGVYASVGFLAVADERHYAGVDEAAESLSFMLADPTPEELARLRAWVAGQLVEGEGGWRLAAPRTVEWAILSWEPGTLR